MRTKKHYNKKLKSYAREHRNNSTRGEIVLWCELLRKKQMMGFSFLRQLPIGPFIADFYCKELNLVIEADGATHEDATTIKKDIRKQRWLEKQGLTVLRFKDDDIMHNIEWVKNEIEIWIKQVTIVNPSPVSTSVLPPPSKGDSFSK